MAEGDGLRGDRRAVMADTANLHRYRSRWLQTSEIVENLRLAYRWATADIDHAAETVASSR